MQEPDTSYEIIILGAGCAGLSLCCHLLNQGVTAPILLLERRTRYEDDRTWCFWYNFPVLFPKLVSHRWHHWIVCDREGREAAQFLGSGAYACVRSGDFYEWALASIALRPNVTLRLGESLIDYAEDAEGVVVRTDKGEYRGRTVFDGASDLPAAGAGDVVLRQRFLGQRVRTERAVFDADQATLMDFGVDLVPHALHFMYVLPFSSHEALVESTVIGTNPMVSEDEHRRQIADYLAKRWQVTDFALTGEERGDLPMTTQRLPLRVGRRVFNIGTLAGSVKPSSGYGFRRIQDHTLSLAIAYATGKMDRVPTRMALPRFEALDAVFLAAMQRHPEQFPQVFHALFSRIGGARLTRFLCERSLWYEDFLVLRVLLKRLFLGAALRSARLWLPRLRRPTPPPTP